MLRLLDAYMVWMFHIIETACIALCRYLYNCFVIINANGLRSIDVCNACVRSEHCFRLCFQLHRISFVPIRLRAMVFALLRCDFRKINAEEFLLLTSLNPQRSSLPQIIRGPESGACDRAREKPTRADV